MIDDGVQPANSPHVARDKVAVAIEANLRKFAKDGAGPLKVREDAAGVHLNLGPCYVTGETYEIALVRMAKLLVDDPRFRGILIADLRTKGQ